MNVSELTPYQKSCLKQYYVMDQFAKVDKFPAWGDLGAADSTVSDEQLIEEYGNVDFVADDFT